jgi:nucleoid DNA-binding protein
MNISKHLSTLIVMHDCVIVPGMGAFLSNYVPSGVDDRTKLFYPPSKEVIFNEKINRNDGMLVSHIADAEGVTYEEALQTVERFCQQSTELLYAGQTVDLEGIGLLKINQYGRIEYISYQQMKPVESMGLVEFSFPKLMERHTVTVKPLYKSTPIASVYSKNRTAWRVAASIALVLSLSLFPLSNQYKQIQTTNITPIVSNQNVALPEALPEEAAEPELEVFSESEPEPVQQVLPYILVAGTFTNQKNANVLVDELKAKGHKSEVILLNDGRYRVSIDSFSEKELALTAMEQFREQNPGSDVWVTNR